MERIVRTVVMITAVVVTGLAPLLFYGQASATDDYEQVVLTMGSWRTEDIRPMRCILDQFQATHPNILITFDPTPAPEYDAVLEAQLAGKTGPDLMYLRSFSTSRKLFDRGYLDTLDDLPGLAENFTPEMLHPWTSNDGRRYGVPFIATSHGIYYNQDLFKRLGLAIPRTWEELLSAAASIKRAGIIPFANASGDSWTINEIVLFNLAPNFIGGRVGRMDYLTGKRCFNDEQMVSAFQALQDLAPYLPENQALLSYTDSLQLFVQGQAAMWWGGSWDIPFFEAESPGFEWSIFAPPPPQGRPSYITFHLDAGLGLNAASRQKEAARQFLTWAAEPEFGRLLGNVLPGFFPMHKEVPKLDNAHANTFLSLNHNRETDVRLVWEKLRDGSPDGYALTMQGALDVINGRSSPQAAADALQSGLAKWFEPARNCSK